MKKQRASNLTVSNVDQQVVTEEEHRHTQLVFHETLAKLPDAAPRTD